ncbi:ecdysone receptor [Aplysia californica]|uniref:Ecdysone receptor n=1 Tax=Aplysia californica TaxID=6500 RepID=A0ABM0JUG3_APLCA|nr:ecdysone receptor [Aplysia californica]
MDMWMRRKCQACRLRRCREVGMKEECLLSEDQCKARDARRKAKQRFVPKKEVHSPDSFGNSMDSDSKQTVLSVDVKPSLSSLPSLPSVPSTSSSVGSPSSVTEEMPDIMKRLHSDQHERIVFLVSLQDKYEFADPDSYEKTLKEFDYKTNSTLDPQTFMNSMASTFVLVTKLIVQFAKELPHFVDVCKEDQITLLKSSTTEVMSIRAARCYDLQSKCIIFANGQPCSLQNMKAAHAGLGNYCERLFEFCHNMASCKTDNAEYALLTAICIFSERPGLEQASKVEEIQDQYVELLQVYETAKRGKGGGALARFLSRLSDLRTISSEHSKLLVEMDVKKVQMDVPSLIKDILLLPPEGN